MAFGWVLPVRGFQILFSIVVLGCFGYLVGQENKFDDYYGVNFKYGEISYGVFCGVWGLITLIYLLLAALLFSSTALANAFIIVALEALNWIFFLACFAANAARLNDLFDGNSDNTTAYHDWVAGTVFAAFEWLLFSATLIAAVMVIVKGKDSKMAGGIAGSGV